MCDRGSSRWATTSARAGPCLPTSWTTRSSSSPLHCPLPQTRSRRSSSVLCREYSTLLVFSEIKWRASLLLLYTNGEVETWNSPHTPNQKYLTHYSLWGADLFFCLFEMQTLKHQALNSNKSVTCAYNRQVLLDIKIISEFVDKN